jgi:type I restriction enzyme M protein
MTENNQQNPIGYIEGDLVIYPDLHGERHERRLTPEERVRLRVIIELVENYGYATSHIDIEVTVPRRTPEDRADIVVYRDTGLTNPFIVVETKKEGLTNADKSQAIEQGFGNTNSLRCPFLLVVAGDEEWAFNVAAFPPQERIRNKIPSIPRQYGTAPEYRYKRGGGEWELRAIDLAALNTAFQRCHDSIWQGGRLNPAQSFDEISKLLFTKYYDEKRTGAGEFYRFQIGTNETQEIVASRIVRLFEEARRQQSAFRDPMVLPAHIIYTVVESLQHINLQQTDIDAKGRAFEKFLSDTFKGQLGQYFTPRNIVQFMVKMVRPQEDDMVLDPACGSAGFLLYSLDYVRKEAERRYDPSQAIRAYMEFAARHIYGIEINDLIARVAIAGMLINDDGSSHILCENSLRGQPSAIANWWVNPLGYDIILTNPPFGAVESEEAILHNYELGSRDRARKHQKTEILFIERCFQLLKPTSILGIVLPDGILANKTLNNVRLFIKRNFVIKAVISLPDFTFKPSADVGIKSSLVFLQRKPNNYVEEDYLIYMALADRVGYDATGRPDPNDLPSIADSFFAGSSTLEPNPLRFWIRYSQLTDRLDVYHYQPHFMNAESRLDIIATHTRVAHLRDLLDPENDIAGGATPKAKSDAYVDNDSEIEDANADFAPGEQAIANAIPFLRIQNISAGEILTNDVKYIKPEIHEGLLLRSQLQAGDVLLTITGRVGTSAVVPNDLPPANINQHIARLRPRQGISPDYISAFLNSELGQLQCLRYSTGTTRIAMDYDAIRNIRVPLPSQEIQQQVVQTVNQAVEHVRQLRNQIKETIANSQFESTTILERNQNI